MSKSSLALNNLRGVVILLVVAFHAFTAYLGSQSASSAPFDSPPYAWQAYPILDSERWFGLDLFCAFHFLYLMQLMFFLSGLFVWPSLRRKGVRIFLQDRFLRLGVPFILGVYLLIPLAYYPAYRVTAVDPSWSAFWSHWLALPFWPTGPMWFLWYLLFLNFLAAGLFRLAPDVGEWLGRLASKAGRHPVRIFAILVAGSALTYMPLSAIFPPWQWLQSGPFALQPAFGLQYALYFVAGLAVGAHGLEFGVLDADGRLPVRWGRWVAGALASFIIWIVPAALIFKGQGGALPGMQTLSDFGLALFSAAACFAMMAIFLRFATAPWPATANLAESAYGIYFVHYTFVVWLQYAFLDLSLPAIAKALSVFSLAVVLSWSSTAAMCLTPFGVRVILGQRRVSARGSSTKTKRYSELEYSE